MEGLGVEQEGVTVLGDCSEPSGGVGRDELSLGVGLGGNAEQGAALGTLLLSRENWEYTGNYPSSSCLWESPCTRKRILY